MRFTKLRIVGFRSHADTQLELERITVIRGANAVGKSSLEEAIAFLLAGRTMSTGENGQGADRLIRSGSDKAIVQAELADGTKVRASLTAKSGRSVTVKDGEMPQLARGAVSCLCSTRYFARLSSADQKALLSSLVVPDKVEIPAEVIEAATTAGIHDIFGTRPALQAIDDAYKQAFEARRDVNRSIRDWVEPDKPEEHAPDVDAVRQHLEQRQRELDAERAAGARLLADYEKRQAAAATLADRAREVGVFLAEQQREHDRISKLTLSDGVVKKLQAAAGGKDEYARLLSQYADAETQCKSASAALDRAVNLEDSPACPTCQQPITDQVLSGLITPLIAANNEAIRARDAIKTRLEAIGNPVEAATKLDQHKEAVTVIRRIEGKIAEYQAKADKLAAEPDAPQRPNTSTIDANITRLEEQVRKGFEAHAKAAAAGQRRKDYDIKWAERRALDARKGALEKAVEILGPNGIREMLLGTYIGAFTDSMNGFLESWGYSVALSLEPYSFQVRRGEKCLDLDLLSESEKLRFGIALQVALALHTGANFIVADQVDMLDAASKRVLFNRLFAEKRLEQIILIGTEEKDDAPPAPGTVFYKFTMQGGDTAVVELKRTR